MYKRPKFNRVSLSNQFRQFHTWIQWTKHEDKRIYPDIHFDIDKVNVHNGGKSAKGHHVILRQVSLQKKKK